MTIGGVGAMFRVDPGGEALRPRVPQGAVTGPVTVAKPEGTAVSADTFVVLPEPSSSSEPRVPPPETKAALAPGVAVR